MADDAAVDAADRDAAHVFVIVKQRDEELQRIRDALGRMRDMLDDRFVHGFHVLVLLIQGHAGCAHESGSVHDRKFKLLVIGAKLDEEVENLVHDSLGSRVRTVDLVQDDDRGQVVLESFAQNELRLRHAAFESVHDEQNAVDHLHDALHFAAEVGVPGSIDDVDEVVLIVDRGVFRQNRNAALPLQIVGVHRPFMDDFVVAERSGLLQQLVDKRRFAVVDVRDNGDIANVLSCLHNF
ncbi:hypothetical protein BN871_AI_01410 [Paenibacillus sp. P22]|nr:hypothetical protein BN871_AI_01410 [Paenibacillus sp. P22]